MSDILAIDAVVNPMPPEMQPSRPEWSESFYVGKIGRGLDLLHGVTLHDMLSMMDQAGIERAFLIACKVGQLGLQGSWHLPYETVAEMVEAYPSRFHALAGIDPTEGMAGVRALEQAVLEFGFIGAHLYPHWFELAPDHAKYYPFYAKCVELDVPIQMQVGQSLVYDPKRPLR